MRSCQPWQLGPAVGRGPGLDQGSLTRGTYEKLGREGTDTTNGDTPALRAGVGVGSPRAAGKAIYLAGVSNPASAPFPTEPISTRF